jgi:crotonobetainyl-CoA:carnitine CoA-transferase CaiB-like acyl-CoA transferase
MPRDPRPLAGIRVLDLGWITAGAGTSSLLADMGADVVKIEGPGAPDPFRQWDGAPPGTDWWNHAPFFAFTNRGKTSLCVDLKSEQGQAILSRLLAEADVLVENYRRGVLASFGFDPALLRQRFPRLVIASISSQGETGPDRDMVSYGSTLEATSGLAALTGTGDAPVMTGRDMNYPDQVVCLFASGAIVAALLERQRTGQGAHLDLAQRELTSFLLGEELIAVRHGAPSVRHGNADPAFPGEQLVRDGNGWHVVGSAVTTPVRDAGAVVAAPEFAAGTSVLHSPNGQPAKGIPFRLGRRPLSVGDNCHTLGADNAAVLAQAGYSEAEIAAFAEAGIIGTAPRRTRPAS